MKTRYEADVLESMRFISKIADNHQDRELSILESIHHVAGLEMHIAPSEYRDRLDGLMSACMVRAGGEFLPPGRPPDRRNGWPWSPWPLWTSLEASRRICAKEGILDGPLKDWLDYVIALSWKDVEAEDKNTMA